MSSRAFRTISEAVYALLVLTSIGAIGLSCVALLAQAVRTSPAQSWKSNFNALVIGGSYIIVLIASLVFCVNRRIAVRQRLQRISKRHRVIRRDDVPRSVHSYISQEYTRACLVSYASQPRHAFRKGWGRPGTIYDGVRFRHALLNTIAEIDELARLVVPSHPFIKPHDRMSHHFRYILPLIPKDDAGTSLMYYYDSAIQLARNSSEELREQEFEIGMEAANAIKESLWVLRLEMLADASTAHLNAP